MPALFTRRSATGLIGVTWGYLSRRSFLDLFASAFCYHAVPPSRKLSLLPSLLCYVIYCWHTLEVYLVTVDSLFTEFDLLS
jgi:hypothetical protein